MKIWAKMANISPPKTSKNFYNELSQYYYGGRVQAFFVGELHHSFNVIDINSAYPYAMIHQHPWGESYEISSSLPSSKSQIERCFIKLTAKSTGAFPFRGDDKSLSFPADGLTREFNITGWEFISAQETGTLLDWEIIEVTRFYLSIEFGEYVDHFFMLKTESKKSGDKAGYLFAKIFLNALYGKFGANPEEYKEYELIPPQYIHASEREGYEFCGELDRWALVQRDLMEEKQHYYNVAVAASITGFVRAYMWKAINTCNDVYYCDTDSIVCRDYGNLEIDAQKLGAWDVEAKCDYGAIAGKKLYAFDTGDGWKTASKGVKLDAEDIIRVAQGEPITYHPQSPQYSLKRGIKFQPRTVQKTCQ